MFKVTDEHIIEVVGNALKLANEISKTNGNVVVYPTIKEIHLFDMAKKSEVGELYKILNSLCEYLGVEVKQENYSVVEKRSKGVS